jgi:hypothetical protein
VIDSAALLSTLQRQLGALLADLHARVDTEPSIGDPLRAEYQRAFDAERTGWAFTEWADDRLTQVAVGWLLACVFVRFCEDNHLVDDAMIAGEGSRGSVAKAAQQDFFRTNPHGSDRDYLHYVFRSTAALPGLGGVLGEEHSPLWLADPSADACSELLELFRRTDDAGALVMDFADPALDTRFLGNLYQDLSKQAKKNYALLQTPIFVEEFILDRTLEPAIESHGLANTTLIDPTCGSGHFLLGAFDRLWLRWADAEPGALPPVIAQRALDAIWGVDLNPFAAATARFRLLVVALRSSQIIRLLDAPDFTIHIAVGDSLLWGAREQHLPGLEGAGPAVESMYLYATEDADELRATFGRTYSAVVGNPPYIVPKDSAANAAYRKAYGSCHRQYSLGVPFTELFFNLADRPNPATGWPAGHIGMITTNSFMKRQFGTKLIEQYIPKWDLTHVIDTSGAYIPGHGTPTVILFGRNQPPVMNAIRTVMGIRGEPSTPTDPTKGLVWTAIADQVDQAGSESDYISVANTERTRFATHPWSIGGGGAAELKEELDGACSLQLQDAVDEIGFGVVTREDDVFRIGNGARRAGIDGDLIRPLLAGEEIRDWGYVDLTDAVWPYDSTSLDEVADPVIERYLWPWKCQLSHRVAYGKSQLERGLQWWEYSMFFRERFRNPFSIAFAFVATHNHFVFDRGGKLFNRSAPVIKLPGDATTEDHLGLLALLNSSVACFWMQQVFHNKGRPGADSAAADEAWEFRYELDGTKLQRLPLPDRDRPIEFGRLLDDLATQNGAQLPAAIAAAGLPTRDRLDRARTESDLLSAKMVAVQEELDWHCLNLFGLVNADFMTPEGSIGPPLKLGERAFEILLARKAESGEIETVWFARHRSLPITHLPSHWPPWYQDLVERRVRLIQSDHNVALVERPEHKRRWKRAPWEELESDALRNWLLDRLEEKSFWFDGGRATVRTVAQLADRAAADADWMSVARNWVSQVDVDPVAAVGKLVADQHVPIQAVARYNPSGLKKRSDWERTWDLQRAEDRGEDVGRIAVPPKYARADFVKTSYWTQRGKLDVPKERFTSVHTAERDASAGDSSMVLAWAGFDHAELAQALATLLFQRQTVDGWTGDRLVPLIAALDEVVPWVEQWHPEIDPGLGQPLGTFYRGQVDQALATIGATRTTLAEWRPATTTRGRKKKTAAEITIEN